MATGEITTGTAPQPVATDWFFEIGYSELVLVQDLSWRPAEVSQLRPFNASYITRVFVQGIAAEEAKKTVRYLFHCCRRMFPRFRFSIT
jgi:hypothetical protein